MSYDNPNHRAVLDAEGLKRWVSPQLDGYESLRIASLRQGFFERPLAELGHGVKQTSRTVFLGGAEKASSANSVKRS